MDRRSPCGGLPKPVVLRCPAHLLEEPEHRDPPPTLSSVSTKRLSCFHERKVLTVMRKPAYVNARALPGGMWIHTEGAPPARIWDTKIVPVLYRLPSLASAPWEKRAGD